jgi:hypothetical protein
VGTQAVGDPAGEIQRDVRPRRSRRLRHRVPPLAAVRAEAEAVAAADRGGSLGWVAGAAKRRGRVRQC